ncbi:MAG: hypothetical protein HC883_01555 [Bdellovibrionaceae bacterium]|nr:hypothetical protein [Pseudobdellovibrionaceae bacterium]
MNSFVRLFCISTFIGLTFPKVGGASALASIYNGQQFNIDGATIVQSADSPSDFYVLPTLYRVRGGTKWDDLLSEYVDINPVARREEEISGTKVVIYTMRFDLDLPSKMQQLYALRELRKFQPNARIVGIAPVCGIRFGDAGIAEVLAASSPIKTDPTKPMIRYSFRSTDADKCGSTLRTTAFTVEYTVPAENAAGIESAMASEAGLVLPPVELVLPYKFKDKVVVKVDAASAIEVLKSGADLEGTYKFVKAGVQARMQSLINRLNSAGMIEMDCQNPDPVVCSQFLTKAMEILSKTLFIFEAQANSGDTNPLVIGDGEKAVDASLIKARVAFESAKAVRNGRFEVDFSNVVYSTIKAQAELIVRNIQFR